ncbi:MAG: hypothetical protein A3205_03765 [Methanomassiliicoccales archaeon Mx-03]|nr:MAG: hypothetical protein A3205_03765 [Methanomassiliicoccales archaeon Mx-03]
MRRVTAAVMLSVIMAFAAVSVCTPFSDANESDSISIIVPSDDLSMEDPLDLILSFEHMSAEIDRADGTILILMTGAPYEDDEIFVAVTEAIGQEMFISSKDLGSIGEFEILDDRSPMPPDQFLGDWVDIDFLEHILAFIESSMRWITLADQLESEIRSQEEFSSKMNANCVYWDSRSCEIGTDRREDEPVEDGLLEPFTIEESDEEQSCALVRVECEPLPFELLSEVGDPGDLPVIGRGTVI